MMIDGKLIAAKRDAYFAGAEGQRCLKGRAEGIYLKNRLEAAFLAGIAAAEKLMSPPNLGEIEMSDLAAACGFLEELRETINDGGADSTELERMIAVLNNTLNEKRKAV